MNFMKADPLLDKIIISLSACDHLTTRSLINGGVLITGGLGRGKVKYEFEAALCGGTKRGPELLADDEKFGYCRLSGACEVSRKRARCRCFQRRRRSSFRTPRHFMELREGAKNVEGIIDFFDILPVVRQAAYLLQ